MAESGVGSEQHWGLCAPVRLDLAGMGVGADASAQRLTCLLAETSDLRYVYAHLRDFVRILRDPARSVRVVLYERQLSIATKLLLKLALLLRIHFTGPMDSKIHIAHAYNELHCNIRVSGDTVTALKHAALVVLALFSGFYRKKLHPDGSDRRTGSEHLEDDTLAVLQRTHAALRAAVDLERLLRAGSTDVIFSICKKLYDYDASLAEHARPGALPGRNVRVQRVTLQRGSMEPRPQRSIEESFDTRLRDYYAEQYDSRANICLWDCHFRLKNRIPLVSDIFYQSFRVSGIPYLRPYFRLPKTLGAAAEAGPAVRRAPTTDESKMYCGVDNITLLSDTARGGFQGDILTGPWLETGFAAYHLFPSLYDDHFKEDGPRTPLSELQELDGPTENFELYRTFQHAGPDSHEPLYSVVELGVYNLLVCADLFAELLDLDESPNANVEGDSPDRRFALVFASGDFATNVGNRLALDGAVSVAVFGIEANRHLEDPEAFHRDVAPCLCRDKHWLLAELGQFVVKLESKLVPMFCEKIRTNMSACGYDTDTIQELTASYPLMDLVSDSAEKGALKPTHLLASKTIGPQ